MCNFQLGTWAEIPSPYVTNVLMSAGFDFSILDMEHGIVDFETAQNMIFAAKAANKRTYVRVPAIEETWVLRVLDMGCDGIIFPQVSNKKDVEKIIEYSCFKPLGQRGFNPYIASGGYSNVPRDYFEKENQRIDIGIILEGIQAFEHIEDLILYDQIKIVYIGQYDLSMALGIPGQVTHPKVLEYMRKTADLLSEKDKLPGCMVHSAEEAKIAIRQGFKFIVYKVDTGLLFDITNYFVKEVKNYESI